MTDIQWLKHNRDVIKVAVVAKMAGIPPRTLSGFVHGQKDAKGYPFKLPEKYQEQLKKVIKSIRKP